jgi:hypothetical protein
MVGLLDCVRELECEVLVSGDHTGRPWRDVATGPANQAIDILDDERRERGVV